MAYAYFPGCSLKGTATAYDESVVELFRRLELPLEELDDWNCCGATSYMSVDEGSAFVLSARNLAIASRQKQDLVAPCSACYLALKKTQDYMQRYPAFAARVGKALNGSGAAAAVCGVRVRHPLEVIYTDVGLERVRKLAVRRWPGGPVACYYGCQMVRPYEGADRQHDPTRMDELLGAAGVATLPYPLKTKCCGGTLTGTLREVGLRLNYLLLAEAVRRGATAISTACPLCQYNLDASQPEMEPGPHGRMDVPILYFTQILAWALGADQETLGFRKCISGRKTVRRWFAERLEEAAYA